MRVYIQRTWDLPCVFLELKLVLDTRHCAEFYLFPLLLMYISTFIYIYVYLSIVRGRGMREEKWVDVRLARDLLG